MSRSSPIPGDDNPTLAADAEGNSSFDYDSLSSPDSRRAYFERNGYLVRPGLIDTGLCRQAMVSFASEIKPYKGHLYRQASANPERHQLDGSGNILNSLLNPLSVDGSRFPLFRAVSDRVLSGGEIFAAIEEIFRERAVLVQSMYFEGNPTTWPHQDSYYLDADSPGTLTGAWVALEDIDARAGRFYVLPGSQQISAGSNSGNMSIAVNHDGYKQRVHDYVESHPAEIRAPVLKCGDVLLWGSRTIHGTMPPTDAKFSRNSYTAHFIPASARFVQYECIPVKLSPETVAGNAICRPKDQNRIQNRWRLAVESRMPSLFPRIKKLIIAREIRRRTKLKMR